MIPRGTFWRVMPMSEHGITSRAAWDARHRDGFGTRSLPATSVWLHHTVTASAGPDATLAADCARLRAVEDVGYARFGGISYTYLITEAGRIFQGHSDERIGAHTSGYNTTGVGISLVGNYEVATPTQAQKDALVWLLRDLRKRGIVTLTAPLAGHYTVKATACPGKNVKPFISSIDAESRKPEAPVDRTFKILGVENAMTGANANDLEFEAALKALCVAHKKQLREARTSRPLPAKYTDWYRTV